MNASAYTLAAAISRLFELLVWFSVGWLFVYSIIGPWLKVKLVHWRVAGSSLTTRRVGPVYFSHLLFSLLLVNPYTLIWAVFLCEDIDSAIAIFLLYFAYFFVLPQVCELLCLRLLPRWWGKASWFAWQPPLKRTVWVGFLISTLAFAAAFALFHIGGMF